MEKSQRKIRLFQTKYQNKEGYRKVRNINMEGKISHNKNRPLDYYIVSEIKKPPKVHNKNRPFIYNTVLTV